MHYFNEEKTKARSVEEVLNQTDREIDFMVYKVYSLSEEEIAMIESN